jgi:hypothetical protein
MQTDPLNCGSCGHVCSDPSDNCVAGVCQAPPASIACDQGRPAAIAVDGASVYWLTNLTIPVEAGFTGLGALMTAPNDGGLPVALVSGDLVGGVTYSILGNGLAVDSTYAFWTNNDSTGPSNTLLKASVAGGTPVTLATSLQYPAHAVVVHSPDVYWANGDSIMRVPIEGGTPVPIVTGLTAVGGIAVGGIAVDASSVYWTNWVDVGSVMKVPLAGGSPTTLAAGIARPVELVVNATTACWTSVPWPIYMGEAGTFTASPSVMCVPLAGGNPTAPPLIERGPLAMDASSLFGWMGAGELVRVPLAGGAPKILASDWSPQNGMTVDATYVYWTDDRGAVLKSLK